MTEHLPAKPTSSFLLPPAAAGLGNEGQKAFLDFFTAQIRNANTRAAYMRAVGSFLAWIDERETTLEAVEAVPHDHPRTSEAEYHRGVALFHLGHVDAARAVWTRVVQRHGEDRWSYRADWAVEDCKRGDDGPGMMGMGSNTLLKRHGYMGRKNPDLSQEVAGGKTGK